MKKIIYEPSKKSIRVWNERHNAKYRLLQGSVRSAKTFLSNDIAIDEIQTLPPCNVLLSGYSISSVARNVLAEWKSTIDPLSHGLFKNCKDGKDDYITINWRGLRGKKFYVRGSSKESDYKQIQGGTFGYWVADELTRHNRSFIDMAMTRLSPPWAKGIWTTNTDSPFHFVKTDFIDNKKLQTPDETGRKTLDVWTFFLKDNPSLSLEYIAELEKLYTGVFYKRYIQSLWVLAEGIIYDMFDENEHILLSSPEASFYDVSIDYGTSNPTVFLLVGNSYVQKPNSWVEREYYYDGRKKQKQKTDNEYGKDLALFIGESSSSYDHVIERLYGIEKLLEVKVKRIIDTQVEKIFLDPSAASFRTTLKRMGFMGLTDADNSVLDGIRTVGTRFNTGELAICDSCTFTKQELGSYCWDARAQLYGEDKPVKQNDHCCDALRYQQHTRYGLNKLDWNKLLTR